MSADWVPGNRVELLENGEEFYPRVFAAIDAARHEVLIETFILCEDEVGHELAERLIAAAGRGVRVELTLDAWGSMAVGGDFIESMTRAGVCVHLFEEKRPRWLLRVSWFRRLHRKLVVLDACTAFVGGINFSVDHFSDHEPDAKQDYAVLVEGPIVAEIHRFAVGAITSVHGNDDRLPAVPQREPGQRRAAGSMDVMFVVRDNRRGRRTTIEQHYRAAVRRSRRRLVIANAYFFPGHLLLRELRGAARRGVDVRLVMQAEPDFRIARFGARLLYDHLMEAGVRIYEYGARQFHGKVAVADDDWTTVGSSNLDPLSLWFNLEANVIVRDEAFNRTVTRRLEALIETSCREVTRTQARGRVFWRPLAGFVAFHVLRRFPRLAGLVPAHRPRLTRVAGQGRRTMKREG